VKTVAIIPARMAASRFPGKPMATILGVPMIGHCYFRTTMSQQLDMVYVATCDKEIYDYITSRGGNAVMTGNHHERAADRTAEAVLKIEKQQGEPLGIVVMVQGDEPMVLPGMMDALVAPFLDDPSLMVTNLMAEIDTVDQFNDPGVVKVVVGLNHEALYFSREPIPSRKKAGDQKVTMLKQTGLMAFRRDYLLQFNRMPQTPIEKIESVDMMRVLENGGRIHMVMSDYDLLSVDTSADLSLVENVMNNDILVKKYTGKWSLLI